MLNRYELKVRITFMDDVLGSWPNKKNIFEEFIASKAPDAKTREQNVEALGVEEVVRQDKTVFPRDRDGNPCLMAYQIKGFLKEACKSIKRLKGVETKSAKMASHIKVIDGNIFVEPDTIPFSHGVASEDCARSLRASTAQGDRIAIANSEVVPVSAQMEFTIVYFDKAHYEPIKEWLDYGVYRGLGQWRNSGKGRFRWEEISNDYVTV